MIATSGYPKERFPLLQTNIFNCSLCGCVVREPQECNGCAKLFCEECIRDWLQNKRYNQLQCRLCPNNCNSKVEPMRSKTLLKIYNDLDVKCKYDNCQRMMKLGDLKEHEAKCQKPKCWNFESCSGCDIPRKERPYPCCSEICELLRRLIETHRDPDKMYKELKEFFSHQQKVQSSYQSEAVLTWDSKRTPEKIQILDYGKSIFLEEPNYIYRSVVTEKPFMSGINYWEIIPDSRTENQLKIGVTTSIGFDLACTAFCDKEFGYAYYAIGQLRHGSNASGMPYGKQFKKKGVVGVCLDMTKGILSFALNGEFLGIAFVSEALKKGPVYPAVALIHCAGCTIQSAPLPSCFREVTAP